MNTTIPKKTVVTTYKNAQHYNPNLSQSLRPKHRYSEISSLLVRAEDLGSKNVNYSSKLFHSAL
jgi:hypothetical protein